MLRRLEDLCPGEEALVDVVQSETVAGDGDGAPGSARRAWKRSWPSL